MNRKTLERLAGHYPKGFKGHQIDMGKWHIPEKLASTTTTTTTTI